MKSLWHCQDPGKTGQNFIPATQDHVIFLNKKDCLQRNKVNQNGDVTKKEEQGRRLSCLDRQISSCCSRQQEISKPRNPLKGSIRKLSRTKKHTKFKHICIKEGSKESFWHGGEFFEKDRVACNINWFQTNIEMF